MAIPASGSLVFPGSPTDLRATGGARLFRDLLDFLACFLDASADVVDRIVDAAAGALHRASRTVAARRCQAQDNQREDGFHIRRIQPSGAGFQLAARPAQGFGEDAFVLAAFFLAETMKNIGRRSSSFISASLAARSASGGGSRNPVI